MLQDVHILMEHVANKDVVFVDLGGNRQLPALVRALSLLIERVQPELIVVKSEELTALASRQCARQAVSAVQLKRQLPTLAPCATAEGLYKLAIDHVLPPPDAPCSCSHGQAYDEHGGVRTVYAKRLEEVEAHPAVTEAKFDMPEGLVPDCTAWWDGVWRPRSCRAGVVVPETWFVRARAKGFAQHPLRFPWRENGDGQPICRFYNYDNRVCPAGEACLFDHDHCHACGQQGHIAQECPVVN